MIELSPKLTQENTELKNGFCLNPFTPLWLCPEPSLENNWLAFNLFLEAKKIDSEGVKGDYLEDIDGFAQRMQRDIYGWYSTALRAWKIKLFRGWEREYGSFKDFCEKALKKTSACINNWIRSARVLSQLISLGFCRLPSSAAVCLELSKLDHNSLGDVWTSIIDDLEDYQITVDKVKERLSDPFQENPKLKQIRIDAEKWEQLRQLAAEGGVSPTKLLDQLIDGYLGQNLGETQNGDRDENPRDSIPTREPCDMERCPDNPDNDGDYHSQGQQVDENPSPGGNRDREHFNYGIIPSSDENRKNGTDGNLYEVLPLQREKEHMPVVSSGLCGRNVYDGLLPLSGSYNRESGRFKFKRVDKGDNSPTESEGIPYTDPDIVQSPKRSPNIFPTNSRSSSGRGDAAKGQDGFNPRPHTG